MSSLFERKKNLSDKHKSIMRKMKHISGLYDEDETENDSSVGFDYSAFMSDTGSTTGNFISNKRVRTFSILGSSMGSDAVRAKWLHTVEPKY